MDFQDRLCEFGSPGAQALQQLHAAQRERQGAWVPGHVFLGGPRIEQRDTGFGQRARRVQGQRDADRAATDNGQLEAGKL